MMYTIRAGELECFGPVLVNEGNRNKERGDSRREEQEVARMRNAVTGTGIEGERSTGEQRDMHWLWLLLSLSACVRCFFFFFLFLFAAALSICLLPAQFALLFTHTPPPPTHTPTTAFPLRVSISCFRIKSVAYFRALHFFTALFSGRCT